VDELASQLGLALALGLAPEVASEVRTIQNELFHLGADLCLLEEDKQRRPSPQIGPHHVERLETLMDRLTRELGPLEEFLLPGGSPGAAALHVARTVCRRAERRAVALARAEPVGPFVLKYLNRLSDALFVLARRENSLRGISDPLWDKSAR
jgi:cob(I)alamin adenosyltransferase